MKRDYLVTWQIDVLADGPVEAAREAETYMLHPNARRYEVSEHPELTSEEQTLHSWSVDLEKRVGERITQMKETTKLAPAVVAEVTRKVLAYLEAEQVVDQRGVRRECPTCGLSMAPGEMHQHRVRGGE